ncbi:MAG: hypothetical protein QNJ69_08975 [Gammaproteobacteria bacterium]|nr:hypothetical protein [Gammaproteobacteria bacterium]
MNKRILTLLLLVSLGACAGNQLSEPEKQLGWIRDANPEQDAKTAISRGDFRLMAMAQRSLVIPGVNPDNSRSYELKCGVNIMQGVGDVIRSQNHLELMKMAHQYALRYNAMIKLHCQP